jgi:hypothetical protein
LALEDYLKKWWSVLGNKQGQGRLEDESRNDNDVKPFLPLL